MCRQDFAVGECCDEIWRNKLSARRRLAGGRDSLPRSSAGSVAEPCAHGALALPKARAPLLGYSQASHPWSRSDTARCPARNRTAVGSCRSHPVTRAKPTQAYARHGLHADRPEPKDLLAAEVVDCTGPDCDITRSPDPLWRVLLARGLAAPDSLRLGVRTADSGALVAKDGTISERLFYIGPLLRADHWEATAVGELRVHAERLGEYLAKRCL